MKQPAIETKKICLDPCSFCVICEAKFKCCDCKFERHGCATWDRPKDAEGWNHYIKEKRSKPRVKTDACRWHTPHNLGYLQAVEDSRERMKRKEKQIKCAQCKHWFWEDEFGDPVDGMRSKKTPDENESDPVDHADYIT